MTYVEVRAKTVELAIEAAMRELGVDDPSRIAVEVIQEPERGFLGFGGQEALVRVRRKTGRRRRERKRVPGPRGAKREPRQRRASSATEPEGEGRDMRRSDRVDHQDDRQEMPVAEQAEIAGQFLSGLIAAYGLEGTVETKVEEDVIVLDVRGEQTEALVGPRGSVRAAIHELTRTLLQRYARESARLRLDIAGYAERRRQALSIYAEQLIDQLLEEGGEIMLEPMSPSDRKVIHDVAAARPGVTSYSEGEPPRRYVVLASEDTGEEE